MKIEIIAETNMLNGKGAEELIEFAGRTCYQSHHNPSGRSTYDYIGNIIAQQHFSVLEHGSVSIYFENVSRVWTHEMVRHRHFSFSQLSGRYVETEPVNAYTPIIFTSVQKLIQNHLKMQRKSVAEIKKKIIEIFPNTSKKELTSALRRLHNTGEQTSIVVSGNHRSWREFIQKRDIPQAEEEMRLIARTVCGLLKDKYPAIYQDIKHPMQKG